MTDNELNALVAERVMGCDTIAPHCRDKRAACHCSGLPHGMDTDGHIPDYTNDIAAAWQVAEKLRLVVRPTVTGQWCAAVLFSGSGRAGCSTVEETYAEARTAPRAICLAALKAVGAFAVAVDTRGEIYFGGEDSKKDD